MRVLHSLLLVASLAGLASAQAASSEMADADVNKWINFFDRLVVTVVKAQATCEKLALDVSTVIDQNKDAIAVARAARAAGKRLPEAAQQHMLEGVKKMVPALRRCGAHDKVKAAFAKLDLNRRSS